MFTGTKDWNLNFFFFNVGKFFFFFKELELFWRMWLYALHIGKSSFSACQNGLCLLVGGETKVTVDRTVSVSNMRADSNKSALCPFCHLLYPPPSPILDLSLPQKASPLV